MIKHGAKLPFCICQRIPPSNFGIVFVIINNARFILQFLWFQLLETEIYFVIMQCQSPPQALCFLQGRGERLVMNRKGPWEGYRRQALSPSRLFSSRERRLGTRQSPHTKRSLSLISLFHFHYSLYTLNCRWSLVFHISQVIFLKIIIQNCFKLES